MEIDAAAFARLQLVPWFTSCGIEPGPNLRFQFERLSSLNAAIESLKSAQWQDTRTLAQGELTGFLAKRHSALYGGHWNQLARDVEIRIAKDIRPDIEAALKKVGVSDLPTVQQQVELDVSRIAMLLSYQKRVKRVPTFFANLLEVYEVGRIPCGWNGDLACFPIGQLMIY